MKKFLENPYLPWKCSSFMVCVLENGHARRVPKNQMEYPFGVVWYLPHHPVVNPNKSDKIRDCAAQYNGVSLNYWILQVHGLTNNLAGVLTRFRQEPIAVMIDVEECSTKWASIPRTVTLSVSLGGLETTWTLIKQNTNCWLISFERPFPLIVRTLDESGPQKPTKRHLAGRRWTPSGGISVLTIEVYSKRNRGHIAGFWTFACCLQWEVYAWGIRF